ncbi:MULTISPECIES: LysR family transcriptional regulator [unclassified Arsukibacterium]|uniref:LysR family transcriptional regulator n=1 Tax=unclassified Arsukibacterium TaxID=2635278 RepID=UPI000C55B0C3|nr:MULTISPECIES: LysR family transcriptional regulator [unclassified Arsukibacterium]MAA94245.1 LysR family transcriptional regulator [Rheinheimera sp.]MBM35105.1 LysR family transcriptional regulator [Rheinheimera sp.]HAW93476.1 LysR family transcriptional regulator [Candidatus Azambacteria bacterium]|tara:strand:- start:43132 stop:44019 length:888 start_codon:yes stop_codon:yes gene_type:complete
MPYRPRSTLEQWRILQAVVDAGGYAQAAELLNKSQSSLNHAVAKLQSQLGVELLEVIGRKAQLTDAGEVMLRRSRVLTQQIEDLELLADNIEQGWEPEIRIAVELAYPKHFLYRALQAFYPLSRGSRVQIIDTVLTGTSEIIVQKKADLVIAGVVPKGYLSEPLYVSRFIAVVGAGHELATQLRLDQNQLSQHLQIVIRDTAQKPLENIGWLKAEQRWTVDNFNEAIEILQLGLGFCWLPDFVVASGLANGDLVQIQLSNSSERLVPMALLTPQEETLGPGSKQLRQLILAEHLK